MTPLSRRRLLAVTGLAAVAGCSRFDTGGAGSAEVVTDDEETSGVQSTSGTEKQAAIDSKSDTENVTLSSAVPTTDETLPLPMSRADLRSEARSGGPPKDGIPSIDEPQFVDADDVDYLDPGDPVFGATRNGEAKAYPQKILVSHEITNDVLGGDPVSVTYCPLTGTVQGIERGDTTFGVSGRLINNNLVMYDRATEAWWPQILATSIPGPWNENPRTASLQEFRLVWTTWGQWREQHPDTTVLSTETGYARNYGTDPYGSYNPKGGYYTRESTLFPNLREDDRYHSKAIVMGARTPGGAIAFLKKSILAEDLMDGQIGETPVLAVHDPRYSTAYVYENPDGAAFDHDGETVFGEDGSEHAPDDLPLARIHTFDAMWFAWSGYYPDTNVYE